MDFRVADELADRIIKGEAGDSYQILVEMCIPYLKSVKRRYRFFRVTDKIIRDELAAAAVADAIFKQQQLGRTFTVWLSNAFRDHCRRVNHDIYQEKLRQAIEDCEIPYPLRTIGACRENPPDQKAAENEALRSIREELANHEEHSRTAVNERTRGLSYEEIATILDRTAVGCKTVFWHDIHLIRDSIGPRFGMNDNDR